MSGNIYTPAVYRTDLELLKAKVYESQLLLDHLSSSVEINRGFLTKITKANSELTNLLRLLREVECYMREFEEANGWNKKGIGEYFETL